jgi:hypothetical protein
MEPILARVLASLRTPPPPSSHQHHVPEVYLGQEEEQEGIWDVDKGGVVDDQDMFDDTGEGMGVEGDLDLEED